MKCTNCGGENVNVQIVDTGSTSKKLGKGIGDHAWNAMRATVALSTLGASNLFIKKAKGNEKTKKNNVKMAICQECGNSWQLK